MASWSTTTSEKRKRIDDDQRSNKRVRNINDEDLSEIVNMVRRNKLVGRGHIEITPELIVEIAQMSRENNVQKSIPNNRQLKENIT